MPASMPTSNSPYPTAPLALLIDATHDQKSINNNCNGAVSESTSNHKLSHRNPTESSIAFGTGEKSHRKDNKMNLQVVCITVTLVICCIVITGLEVSILQTRQYVSKHTSISNLEIQFHVQTPHRLLQQISFTIASATPFKYLFERINSLTPHSLPNFQLEFICRN